MLNVVLASPPLFAAACLVLGLVVGSFLNVVAYRLPLMLERQWQGSDVAEGAPRFDLLQPGSHCPRCKTPVAWRHNVPLLGWLWLRGRCAACRAPIPVRYPLLELAAGLLAALVALRFGPTPAALAAMGLSFALLTLTVIDIDHMLLPDAITLPGIWAGLLVNLGGTFTNIESAVIGAAAGYLVLWLVYHLFRWFTGKEGMGYGDFKLLAAIGAWLGWQVLPATVLIAAGAGLLYALATFLAGRRQSAQPIPFGPFLAVGGWVCLLERDTVLTLFLG